MNADAKLDPSLRRQARVALGKPFCTSIAQRTGVDHAAELDETARRSFAGYQG
jgi:hypothetical protein